MTFDPDDIVEMAIQEMGDRLADPDRRGEIPAAVLVKFLSEWNKSFERARAVTEATPDIDLLEIVRKSDLPPAKKRSLLETEIKRLGLRQKQLEKELKDE